MAPVTCFGYQRSFVLIVATLIVPMTGVGGVSAAFASCLTASIERSGLGRVATKHAVDA